MVVKVGNQNTGTWEERIASFVLFPGQKLMLVSNLGSAPSASIFQNPPAVPVILLRQCKWSPRAVGMISHDLGQNLCRINQDEHEQQLVL